MGTGRKNHEAQKKLCNSYKKERCIVMFFLLKSECFVLFHVSDFSLVDLAVGRVVFVYKHIPDTLIFYTTTYILSYIQDVYTLL